MKIPIGIDKDTSEVILIEDLSEEQRGLKSNCICPECKSELVARMGDKTVWHFAHYRGNESQFCQETALHILGKHVLSKLKTIPLIDFDNQTYSRKDILGRSYSSENKSLFGKKKIEFKSAKVEKTIGTVRSDVFVSAVYEGVELDINFEIKVWHKVDDDKEDKLKVLELNTVEIDISNLLQEGSIGFKEVKQELEQAYNQKIINLTNQFINHVNQHLIEQLDQKVDRINNGLRQWINLLEGYFLQNGFKLPCYEFTFQKIPTNKFGEIIKSKLPSPPQLDKRVKIKSFEHIEGMSFELVAKSGKELKPIDVLFDDQFDNVTDTENLRSLQNLLVFDAESVNQPPEFIRAKWGKNRIALEYIEKCNGIIEGELAKRKQFEQKQLDESLERAEVLISTSEKVISQDYDKIKNLSVRYFKELVNKGFEEEYLNLLIWEDIDPYWIYGCQPKLWQMILIRDICWVNNDGVEVGFSAKRLAQLGVDLVSPYKDLMYKSKLLKAKGIEMPFVTPYKMLMSYFEYLKIHGFLSGGFGARYKKQHIFGDSFKTFNKHQHVRT
ncbi:MAG: competence protein CoiA family protein [Colwellia sp.]